MEDILKVGADELESVREKREELHLLEWEVARKSNRIKQLRGELEKVDTKVLERRCMLLKENPDASRQALQLTESDWERIEDCIEINERLSSHQLEGRQDQGDLYYAYASFLSAAPSYSTHGKPSQFQITLKNQVAYYYVQEVPIGAFHMYRILSLMSIHGPTHIFYPDFAFLQDGKIFLRQPTRSLRIDFELIRTSWESALEPHLVKELVCLVMSYLHGNLL